MSIICFMLVVRETASADIDVVKSSTMAALFTIGAEEKEDMARRLLREGEKAMIGAEDLRLAPHGIAGKLHRRGSKCALGDA